MVLTRSQRESKKVVIKNIVKYDDDIDNSKMYGYKFEMSDSNMNVIGRMSSNTQCCETVGVYSVAKMEDYIGAEYKSVTITKKEEGDMWNEENMIFVTVSTDRGDIDFYLYNNHNGYYRNNVYIESEKGKEIFNI